MSQTADTADTDEFPGWTPPSTPDDAPELTDDDLIELAEWLDDEDDDDDADFERQSSAIDDLSRVIGHPMAGGQHKEQV